MEIYVNERLFTNCFIPPCVSTQYKLRYLFPLLLLHGLGVLSPNGRLLFLVFFLLFNFNLFLPHYLNSTRYTSYFAAVMFIIWVFLVQMVSY